MPFFMNPFFQDFRGNWVLGDRAHIPTFLVPLHKARDHAEIVCYNTETYDLSVGGDEILTIRFAMDPKREAFADLNIDVSGATVAATTAQEVVDALIADATFNSLFTAEIRNPVHGGIAQGPKVVVIKAKKSPENFRFYIANTGAEQHLKFNKFAGVEEIPTYFSRHTVQNTVTAAGTAGFEDSVGLLLELNPADAVDLAIIRDRVNDASWTSADLLEDWELLKGRSGLFQIEVATVDGSGRPVTVKQWPSGAKEGDLGKLITYVWGTGSIQPLEKFEEPYVLDSTDAAVTPGP